jgi:cytochrome c biogenesis protein CcdA
MRTTIAFPLLVLFSLVSSGFLAADIIVFYAPDCEECFAILNDSAFMMLDARSIRYYNVNTVENYELLLKAENLNNRRSDDFPTVVAGDTLFFGEEILPNISTIKARSHAIAITESLLAQGVSEEHPTWEKAIADTAKTPEQERIYIAFFTEAACLECTRIEKMLHYFEQKYPALFIKTYDVRNREHQMSQEGISIAFKVPEAKRLIAPTLFLCDTFLIDEEICEKTVEELIQKSREKSSVPPWQKGKKYEYLAHEGIQERFKEFGPFVIFVAGLVDGVNPCAFATIVFFLSFMALIGRSRREILTTGVTFISVVFIIYLLIGMLLYRIVGLHFLTSIRYLLHYAIAAFAFILGIISIVDAVMIAKGRSGRMILKLPGSIRRRMEKTIVRESKLRSYIASAVIAGVVVSFLEFSCTGQVYIPTIFFVSGVSDLKLRAYWFLILYNIAFIIPLIILFLLAAFGLSSEKLYGFMRRRTLLLKIATAVIFIALAFALIIIR